LNIIQKITTIHSIFLAVILITGTFAAVYPSFIIGIQAQSEYEYENGYEYEKNNDHYSSEEYPSKIYEYPQQQPSTDEYESNYENDDNYYSYPPTQEPIAANIVVPNDFPTIQKAINAANEGDVIKVLPGTYTEQLNITKSLTIIGSGAKSTIIEAPLPLEELELNLIGLPYIVNIDNQAQVSIKEFTIKGIEGTDCDGLLGISVFGDATLKLYSAIIKDCTFRSVFVGTLLAPGQSGHATITNTLITDYQNTGVFAVGPDSTLTMSNNKVVGSAPDVEGIIGIFFLVGAIGTITHNEVIENICNVPDTCGPDFFNQIQAFGIAAQDAGQGSVISNNYVSNNDAGISVGGPNGSGCCIIDRNKLTDNRFFGIEVDDDDHIISNTKIFGGKVGAAAIAISANTTATLDQVKIIGAETPIQALSSGNLTAAVNVLSPSFFQP
jgi:hypothetical protein